jgi:hypothetical protein
MDGSHNGRTYTLDKMTPIMPKRVKVKPEWAMGLSWYEGYGSVKRQMNKHAYKKKQRAWNKRVTDNGLKEVLD